MNAKWHEQHALPTRASVEQRIEWHREHQVHCACRPIPTRLLARLSASSRAQPARSTAEGKFSNVVLAFADQPSVTYGGKGSGGAALKLDGKIFAMLTPTAQFVVKLSKARVEELVGQRQGECFDPGHGRLMQEWLVVVPSSARWLELAREAHATASSRPGRSSHPPPRPSGARARPRTRRPAKPGTRPS